MSHRKIQRGSTSVLLMPCAVLVVSALSLGTSQAAERSPATVIAVDALKTAAAKDGPYAAHLRRLAVALDGGYTDLTTVDHVVSIIAGLQALDQRSAHIALPSGVQSQSNTVAITGGAAAVESVLDGVAPSVPALDFATPTPSSASVSGGAAPAEIDPIAAVLAEPMPEDPDVVDLGPAVATVVKAERKDDGPDIAMLEGAGLSKGQVLMVRRGGKKVVEVMVLRSEDGFSLGMVLNATWAEQAEQKVVPGDQLWVLEDE